MLQTKFTKVLQNSFLSNTKFLLFIIVIFGLFLRLVFFSGMGTSDDLAYSRYAHNIDKGIDQGSTLTLAVRIGIIYVTALSYSLFSVNDFSSVFFVLLTSIGSIILIFYFGRLLFNERVGLMAAFLLSFFPLDVVYSTKLLTDIPSTFFMALGVYFFLYSEKKSKLKYNIGYFLSGLFIGIGYLIRESILLIGLFFIIYAIFKRKIRKEYFLIALGFLIIFVIESLIFYALTGDPLFRSNASQQYLLKSMDIHGYFGRLSFPTSLLHYPYIILTNTLISYFYIFIFIAIIYCLVYKKKETYNMMFWFLPLLLYLSYGTSSFLRYIPFKADPRYLTIITIPGILILAYFLLEKEHLIKRTIMPSIITILLFSSIGFIYINEERHSLNTLKKAYFYLKVSDKPIYTDQRSKAVFDYLSGYENKTPFKEFNRYESALYEGDKNSFIMNLTNLSDAYIVINQKLIKGLPLVHKDMKFPKEVYSPPDDWIIIKEIGKNNRDKIVIYYVP